MISVEKLQPFNWMESMRPLVAARDFGHGLATAG